MQQTFYHARVQQFEGLHDELRELNQQYLDRHFALTEALPAWLARVEETYNDGRSFTERAEVGRLRSYLATAARGFDPDTQVPLRTGRRARYRAAMFYALERVTTLLAGTLDAARGKLAAAAHLLDQLLLSALQNGVLSEFQLASAAEPAGREELWQTLMAEPATRPVARRVKADIHPQDVLLLVADAAARLR